MGRRKANSINGIDCDKYAEQYAAQLLRNTTFRVTELHKLCRNKIYNRLTQHEQKEVVDNIRIAAKELLYANGYGREMVDGIFRNNQ
jgi:hypothetical protein